MATPLVKSKVLIVEDELVVARDIEQQLCDLGYDPVGAVTRGEQAVEFCAQTRPDLVLMDIQLAGAMDGIAAAQLIRNQFALPVVFLTAFTADDVLARAKLTEPFGYILKPFSERELRTVLAMALYKHEAELRLQNSTRQLKPRLSVRVFHADLRETGSPALAHKPSNQCRRCRATARRSVGMSGFTLGFSQNAPTASTL